MNTLQLQFLISILAGWVSRGQQDVIEYVQEENCVLREHLGAKRLLFTDAFREVLRLSGVKTVKLPARSPDLKTYAERFVLSIRSECLAQIIPLGERYLRKVVQEYTEHYHVERNHQGRGNELIETRCEELNMDGAVECQERLVGVLEYYRRAT